MTNITNYPSQEYPRSNLSLQENFLEKCSSLITDLCILIGIITNIAFSIFGITSNYPIFGVGFFISSSFEIYLFMQMKKGDQYSLFKRDIQQANREMSDLLHLFENQITHFSSSFQNASETLQSHNETLQSHNENLGWHIQNLSATIARIESRN